MVFLGNAFSLQMLDLTKEHEMRVTPLSKQEADSFLLYNEFISCIGHADTAAVLDNMLETHVECNRVNVKLTEDDVLIVAQLTGGRLPEGATTLPEGFDIVFLEVSFIE